MISGFQHWHSNARQSAAGRLFLDEFVFHIVQLVVSRRDDEIINKNRKQQVTSAAEGKKRFAALTKINDEWLRNPPTRLALANLSFMLIDDCLRGARKDETSLNFCSSAPHRILIPLADLQPGLDVSFDS